MFVSSYIEITEKSFTFTKAGRSLPWAPIRNGSHSQLLMLSLCARNDVLAMLWLSFWLHFQIAERGEIIVWGKEIFNQTPNLTKTTQLTVIVSFTNGEKKRGDISGYRPQVIVDTSIHSKCV